MTALTVFVPTHGRPVLLGRTLESVAACARPAGYVGCVVVENGPRAGAEAVVAEAARACPEAGFRYLHVERANKSAALNAALVGVEGLAVFFDDDVRVEPATLAAYSRAFGGVASGGERAYFGGDVQSEFETEPPTWLLPLLPASVRGFSVREAAGSGHALGANWAAHVDDLRAAGGFDPNFGPGSPTRARGQETEMQGRLQARGLSMVPVADAVVHHGVPADRCSSAWAVERSFSDGTSRGLRARQGAGPRLLRECGRELVRQSPRYVRAALRARSAARVEAQVQLAYWVGYLYGYSPLHRTPAGGRAAPLQS